MASSAVPVFFQETVIPTVLAHPISSVAEAAQQTSADVPAARLSLEQAIATHGPAIARLIHRLSGWQKPDCDDVLQDVFVSALKHLDRFEGRSAVPTWLTRIAINAVRAERRRRLISAKHWLRLARRQTQAEASPADGVVATDEQATVVSAMQALPAKFREVLVLRYLQDMELAEAAEALGLSPNHFAVRLHRAKQMLETMLREA